ncbi:hypothetical protein V6N11_014360 [Hibiscus sabdariffa]|uniref:Uncharacterized protein n=2 Tax=Hibiscus sabdariffa TaxID=183260 RepID=A0ABR2A9J1_9ROSI
MRTRCCKPTEQVDLIPFPSAFRLTNIHRLLSDGASSSPPIKTGRRYAARSRYHVSDWTGMKLVFSLAWIGFILAQRPIDAVSSYALLI